MYDLLLRNGRVLDGTGAPAQPADVAIQDGRIIAIGDLSAAPTSDTIDATVSGDQGNYRVGCDPAGWYCSCPAHTRRCSHIVALKRVTVTSSRTPQDPNVKTFTNSTGRKEPAT